MSNTTDLKALESLLNQPEPDYEASKESDGGWLQTAKDFVANPALAQAGWRFIKDMATDPLTYLSFVPGADVAAVPIAGLNLLRRANKLKQAIQLYKNARASHLNNLATQMLAKGAAGAGVQAIRNKINHNNDVSALGTGALVGGTEALAPMVTTLGRWLGKGGKAVYNATFKPSISKEQFNNLVEKSVAEGKPLNRLEDIVGAKKESLVQDARRGNLGSQAKNLTDAYDSAREQSIANQVNKLFLPEGRDITDHNLLTEALESTQNKFKDLKAEAKKGVDLAYAKAEPELKGLSLTDADKASLSDALRKYIPQGINEGQYYDKSADAIKDAINRVATASNAHDLELNRRLMLEDLLKHSKEGHEAHALGKANDAYDEALSDFLKKNNAHANITNARSLYKSYVNDFVYPKERTLRKQIALLENPYTTEHDFTKSLTGDTGEHVLNVSNLQRLFGDDSAELDAIRSAYAHKVLTKPSNDGVVVKIPELGKALQQKFSFKLPKVLYGDKIADIKTLAKQLETGPKDYDFSANNDMLHSLGKEIPALGKVVQAGDNLIQSNEYPNLMADVLKGKAMANNPSVKGRLIAKLPAFLTNGLRSYFLNNVTNSKEN